METLESRSIPFNRGGAPRSAAVPACHRGVLSFFYIDPSEAKQTERCGATWSKSQKEDRLALPLFLPFEERTVHCLRNELLVVLTVYRFSRQGQLPRSSQLTSAMADGMMKVFCETLRLQSSSSVLLMAGYSGLVKLFHLQLMSVPEPRHDLHHRGPQLLDVC